MAWITDAELKTAISAALGNASSADLPAHWSNIVPWANGTAYRKARGLMLARGFTTTQVDAWDAREDWNERLGVLLACWRASKRGEGTQTPSELKQEYEDALKELAAEAVTVNGVYVPSRRVSYGDMDTGEDRFTMDEPDGEGDFSVGEGTTL